MNIVEHLITEHINHLSRFDEPGLAFPEYQTLRDDIIRHVHAEEKVVFPALIKIKELAHHTRMAWEEHNLIMQLLQELDGLAFNSTKWTAKFDVLGKLLRAHMKGEEDFLFYTAPKHFSSDELEELYKTTAKLEKRTDEERVLYPDGKNN